MEGVDEEEEERLRREERGVRGDRLECLAKDAPEQVEPTGDERSSVKESMSCSEDDEAGEEKTGVLVKAGERGREYVGKQASGE